jgi:hypothetical protein
MPGLISLLRVPGGTLSHAKITAGHNAQPLGSLDRGNHGNPVEAITNTLLIIKNLSPRRAQVYKSGLGVE